MKNPAVNFYTGDFLNGVAFFNNEQTGAYIKLLCYQHQLGHLTEKQVYSITKDEEVLSKFKQDKKGLFFNERMEKEITKKKKYSESRAKNRYKTKKKETKNDNTYEKDMNNICNSYEEHMENKNINKNKIKNIINYLNSNAGKKFKSNTSSTVSKINARLREGFTEEDFYKVIDKKVEDWKNTEWEKYLRPETLFGTKFESYLNQTPKEATPKWFDKPNRENQISTEEEQEMAKILEEIGRE